MAKGGCLVTAALAACWGSAGRALAAADSAATRVDRGTHRWPWLNRLRRKSDEGEAAAAPDESPRTRRVLTACDAGSFWSLATATCEVCGSGEFSASGAAACTRCGDFSYELEDNAWPAESRTVDVGACNCQGAFPYQSTTGLCYTDVSYANAGSGPCGSWCTFDAAVGSGCGDNSAYMCSDACDLETGYIFQAGRCYPQSEAPVINTAGLMSDTLRRTGTPQECYDYCTGISAFNIMGLDLRPTGGQDCQCNHPSVKSRER